MVAGTFDLRPLSHSQCILLVLELLDNKSGRFRDFDVKLRGNKRDRKINGGNERKERIRVRTPGKVKSTCHRFLTTCRVPLHGLDIGDLLVISHWLDVRLLHRQLGFLVVSLVFDLTEQNRLIHSFHQSTLF